MSIESKPLSQDELAEETCILLNVFTALAHCTFTFIAFP
jgi:hypothetical protein